MCTLGGHGPLTPFHGFTADTALSFDVVTASGEFLTANSEQNPDLFWALKGGGPGTYAVVLSVTLKTFAEQKAAGVIVNINSTLTQNETLFWEGVKSFNKYTNDFVGSGLYVYFELMNMRLHIQPFVGIGKTKAEVEEILKPMFDEFDAKGVPYETVSKEFDTLFELYIDMFEDEGAGTSALTGGWMFTHQDVEEHNDEMVEAFKTAISPREDLVGQGAIIGHLWDAGLNMPISNSATNPRFRNSTNFSIVTLPVPVDATWAQKEDLQDVLTNIQDAAMKSAGPHGCAYVNEVRLLLLEQCVCVLSKTDQTVNRETHSKLTGNITSGARSTQSCSQSRRNGTLTEYFTAFQPLELRIGRSSSTEPGSVERFESYFVVS